MAATIDATLSGANSNSYITLADAEIYFSERLHTTTWDSATEDQKNRALIMATKRIDQEEFYGDRSTSTQKLKFPRNNLGYLDGVLLDGTIPTILKEAQCELSIHLLSVDISKPGVTSDSYSEIKIASITIKPSIDSGDNSSTSNSTLPPYVVSLLSEISRSSSMFIEVTR